MNKLDMVQAIPNHVDYALPQGWVDDVQRATGKNPVPHFVWYYPPSSGVFGMPMPITMDGYAILHDYITYGVGR